MEIVIVASAMFWLLILSLLGVISAQTMSSFVQILVVIAIAAMALRSIAALARSIQPRMLKRHTPV